MSMHIRYAPERRPLFPRVHSEARLNAAYGAGSLAAALKWIRQRLVDGADRASGEAEGHRDFAAPPREARSLFQAWAASDLSHRDVAGQFWSNMSPN